MAKYKVNIQAPDKGVRECGIWNTVTNTVKCVCNRVFGRKEVKNLTIFNKVGKKED